MTWQVFAIWNAAYTTTVLIIMGAEVWFKFRRLRQSVELMTAELHAQRLPPSIDREYFDERIGELDEHLRELTARIHELERLAGVDGT